MNLDEKRPSPNSKRHHFYVLTDIQFFLSHKIWREIFFSFLGLEGLTLF